MNISISIKKKLQCKYARFRKNADFQPVAVLGSFNRGARLGLPFLLEGHIQPREKRQIPHSDLG